MFAVPMICSVTSGADDVANKSSSNATRITNDPSDRVNDVTVGDPNDGIDPSKSSSVPSMSLLNATKSIDRVTPSAKMLTWDVGATPTTPPSTINCWTASDRLSTCNGNTDDGSMRSDVYSEPFSSVSMVAASPSKLPRIESFEPAKMLP